MVFKVELHPMGSKDISPSTYTILQIVALDDTGDSCYRMSWPAQALAKRDPALRVINMSFSAAERYHYAHHADLLVLFNPNDIDMLTVIEARKQRGLKTIVELNDNFYNSSPWFPVAKNWELIQTQLNYEAFMQIADSVMVTGPGLEQLFSDKTTNSIKQIKNYLPFVPRPLKEMISSKNPSSFGWAGSLGHIADILAVTPSIHAALDHIPSSFFHIMGNDSLQSNLHIAPTRLKYTGWGSMEQYYQFWQPVAVGIIPLLDTPYNCCRSDIKLIEMVASGVLPIVPQLLPYRELIERFKIPSYSDQESLTHALKSALEWSPELRESRLSSIHEYVCNERVEAQATERYDYYQSLMPKEIISTEHFSLALGYMQIDGTPSAILPHTELLQEIHKRISSDVNQLPEAIKQLRALVSQSPRHTEYALALFSLLKKSDSKSTLEFIQKCLSKFPLDIRFNLNYLSMLKNEALVNEWQLLLDRVETAAAPYRNNAREQLKKFLMSQIKQNPQLISIVVERYLEIFPQQHHMRLYLATCYEQIGANEQAQTHFSQLLDSKKLFDEGFGELATMEVGYLAAWDEALRKRISSLT
jgi:tetratricopeptide (TPR) repeat protein